MGLSGGDFLYAYMGGGGAKCRGTDRGGTCYHGLNSYRGNMCPPPFLIKSLWSPGGAMRKIIIEPR